MIEVLDPGALTTVQDLGRPGLAHLGVPRAGALDEPALRLANRLVGNPEQAAGLEVTLTGCRLRLRRAATVAMTGGIAKLTVAGQPASVGVAVPVPADAVIHIGPIRDGVRAYLAISGGIDVPPVLGSRSTDTLSGLGPPPLSRGATLPLGAYRTSPATSHLDHGARWSGGAGAAAPSAADPAPTDTHPSAVELRVRLGPRADWFTPEAVEVLLGAEYQVSPVSNRVAVRLAGPALARAIPGELPSEGVVLGAVQVPAGGDPLVFLADHPTTGGYPVIAVVHPADVFLLAQARPGTTVRFCGPER